MEDIHGKEISLQYVTVKIPGQKPRGSKVVNTTTTINEPFIHLSISSKLKVSLVLISFVNVERIMITLYDKRYMEFESSKHVYFFFQFKMNDDFPCSTNNERLFVLLGSQYKEKRCSDKVTLTAFEVFKEPNSKSSR